MVENVTQIKIEITITDNVSAKNEKTSSIWKKIKWNLSTCTWENGKCSGSIIDDEIIEVTKTVSLIEKR